MALSHWIALFERHAPSPFAWNDAVVGYDFGILGQEPLQAWASSFDGPVARRLSSLEGASLLRFEETLWAACEEATGRVPRPGGQRWMTSQDRWRSALLLDALEAPLGPEALAAAVEAIYELVGCPEDMLGLWTRPAAARGTRPTADRAAIKAFCCRQNTSIATRCGEQALALSGHRL